MSATEKPGLVVSSAAHVAMLAAAILSFSRTPKFNDAQEAIPIEMVTTQDLNDIMRGDKKAKSVQPTPKADKIAELTDTRPLPPVGPAKKDVPTPPPPLKREPDPGEADKAEPPKPPDPVAAMPPPRPEAITPPKPAVVDKPPPDNAEPLDPPKPVARPKPEPPKPEPAKEEPKKPDPKLKLDEVAKLLETHKDVAKPVEKPAAKPKSADEPTEAQHKFDISDISKLLSKETPERKASTSRVASLTPSLGSPNTNAVKMSPSLQAQMDGWFRDRFQGCWTTPITQPAGPKYVPMIRVLLNVDGSLSGDPVLLNPPSDPAWRALADSAVRAVRRCNPLPVPDKFKPYYEEWKDRAVQFVAET